MTRAYPGRGEAIVATAPHSIRPALRRRDQPRAARAPLIVDAEPDPEATADPHTRRRALGHVVRARVEHATVIEHAAQRGGHRDDASEVRARMDDLRQERARDLLVQRLGE